MIMLLSPAKRIDTEPCTAEAFTQPQFKQECMELVEVLKHFETGDLEKLMKISTALASENKARYNGFSASFSLENAKPAVMAFDGDVYNSMENKNFKADELQYLQEHLGILSGLYGFLRPMDLIQPYRLEMGTRLVFDDHKNLYSFWGSKITDHINNLGHKVVVNLASKEYFKAVKPKQLNSRLVNIDFKEWRGDKFKVIAFNAKRARGMMCRFALDNRVTDAEQLKHFDHGDYVFNPDLSTTDDWVFTRS